MRQHFGGRNLPGKNQDANFADHPGPQQPGDGDVVEGIAQPDHRGDEADRTPRADAPVARAVLAEIGERGRLHQRHRGAPEKTHQPQHQKHAPETGGRKHAQVAHRAQGRGDLHHQQALAGVIGQPAPEVRRDHAHHRLHRHQDGDLDGVEVDGLEVQAPIGREHPHEGVVEKIESGDAPVVILGSRHNGATSKRRALSHAVKIIFHLLLKWET